MHRRGPLVLLVALVGAAFTSIPAQKVRAAEPAQPIAVVAHIDAGINPYHEAFRDRSPLAQRHPSTYIANFPSDVPALRLTLDAPTWEAAFAKDKKIWDELLLSWQEGDLAGRMFWIPGTRIIAAGRLSPGGVYCPPVPGVEPAPNAANAPCTDWPILDDMGHGTMTASRMAGAGASLCETCRIVSVEGLGDASVATVAELGYVDVQTNSWGYIVGHPVIWAVDEAGGTGIRERLEEAARTHLVLFGSGNGLNFFLGGATWPTQLGPTLVEGAIWVGAHDNGRVAPWSGAPAHLLADGYAGPVARNKTVKGLEPSPFACCTSASSPYAAGMAAGIVLEARHILGDSRAGVHGGVVAQGPAGRVAAGPLRDGRLTLDELRALVKRVGEAPVKAGRHDGKLHWAGGPAAPELLPHGIGSNPYCPACYTLPVSWTQVQPGTAAIALGGYGGANERALDLARRVLAGTTPEPNRADVDAFFTTEGQVRRRVHHPERP